MDGTFQLLSKSTALSALRVLAILTLAIVGCAEKSKWDRVAVSGTVTLDGKPFDGGVCFRPERGVSGPTVSAQVTDGEFRFRKTDGPVVGSHKAILMPKTGGQRDDSFIAKKLTVEQESPSLSLEFTSSKDEPDLPKRQTSTGGDEAAPEK